MVPGKHRQKKVCKTLSQQKKAVVAIFISDKEDFKPK
jgi:hypothetical protein